MATIMSTSLRSVAGLAMAICLVQPALAQDAPASAQDQADAAPSGLGDIVVTAQKRSENLQDVPIAISAFTAQALADRGVSDVASLAKLAPNVTLDSGSFAGGSASVLSAFIRGIGQSDFAFNFDPGVGVYLDGVYLGRTIGANVGLFDVERIEVLKGPQGTLFGRNTIGGAVNIVTLNPEDKFRFSAEVTTGRYNRIDARTLIAGPITDGLAGSLAFGTKNRDGYMKRQKFDTTGYYIDNRTFAPKVSYPDKEGGQGEYNVRGKLRFTGIDGLDVVASADYSRIKTTNVPQTLLEVSDGGLGAVYNACINTPSAVLDVIGLGLACGPRYGIGTPLAGANVDADPYNDRLPFDARYLTGSKDKNYATNNSQERTKNYGGSLIATLDIGSDMALKSITAYRELRFLSAADLDGTPIPMLEINSRVKQSQFSQELQLTGKALDNKLNYVLGAYYFDEKATTDDYVAISELLLINAPADIKAKAKAVYGQVDYRMSDLIGITVGARYTEENKSIFVGQQDLNALSYKLAGCFPVTDACRIALGFPNPNNPYAYAPGGYSKRKFTNFAPKIGVQLHVNENSMVYGSWSKGYKSGGWTTRLSSPVQELPSFNPEKASTFELGLKTDLLDRTVRLNGAVFYTDYKGIQLNFQEGVSPVIKNAGDAEIYGAEAEATVLVANGLTLRGAVGYIHNKYTRLAPGAVGITSDNKLPKTPKWKVSVSPQYEYALSSGGAIILTADYSYSSATFNDVENSPVIKKGEVNDLSMAVTYKGPENWRFTVGGTNLLNSRYLTAGQNQQAGVGLQYGTYNRPTEWYASVRVDF